MRLDPGQQVSFDYNTIDLNNQLLRFISPRSKVSFIVSTTTNKKYYSNKCTKEHITGHIDFATKMK